MVIFHSYVKLPEGTFEEVPAAWRQYLKMFSMIYMINVPSNEPWTYHFSGVFPCGVKSWKNVVLPFIFHLNPCSLNRPHPAWLGAINMGSRDYKSHTPVKLYIQLGRPTKKVLGNIEVPPPLNLTFNWEDWQRYLLGNIEVPPPLNFTFNGKD